MIIRRALLDTNIIIHREASTVINENIGALFNWLEKLKYMKCVHPLTLGELAKHKDPKTSKSMSIKLSSYDLLKTEAPIAPQIADIVRTIDKDENDINDSKLLNELLNNRVDILITEDISIHNKAILLGLSNRTFSIETFLQKVAEDFPRLIDYRVLSIRKEYFGNININDPFFDSFKEDYIDYRDWFRKKSDDIAYVCKQGDSVRAFLYIKIETNDESYSDMLPIFPSAKRLKIGALKVSQYGNYLGERLLKIIFDNALVNQVKEIYFTIFPKRPEQLGLIHFMKEWGFKEFGKKWTTSGEEIVYVRNFERAVSIERPATTFPYLSKTASFFIVPIKPEYHTELFPDSILRTETPAGFSESEPHRNALRKVYISHSIERGLRSGDVIVFYRTGGLYKGVVTTLGIVEDVVTGMKDAGEMIRISRKRSVLTDHEMLQYWNKSPYGKPFLVNFIYAYSFPKRPNLAELIELGIIPDVTSAPRGFSRLSWEKFYKIVRASTSNENIIVD